MAITHTASGRSTTEESYNYTYDALDRPLQTRYSINNGCSVTLADNQYDEFGRLQTDRRNGSASLATEYSYNIHGMPTRISTPLYTESLFYEQSHNGSTPQYGGNISAIDWSVADESDTYGQRGYIFSYDGMSRLTAAGYLENGKRNDHFSTSYKYDLMGNILSLRREGLLNSGNYGTIDDLTYSYKGNQVVKIDDAAEESPSYKGAMHFRDYADEETEYTYDANGNMLTDSNKGITSIDYNVLDLPQCISTKSRALFKEDSNDTIYYTYSADGTKLRSTYKKAEYRVYPYNPETSLTSFNVETGLNVGTVGMAKPIAKRLKTKYYYCSNLVYDNDNISAILFDGGYASVDDDNGIVMHFYVKDHLGSNRLVVDGNGNIEEVNHYYPFGALMGDRCGVSRNNYKYIGKELDTMYGWNMQDHEARWYDAVDVHWICIDPFSEKYYNYSTKCYCKDNPIIFYDGNGKAVFLYATYLPSCLKRFLGFATHTFIVVTDSKGQIRERFAYGPNEDNYYAIFTGTLGQQYYVQDEDVAKGKDTDNLRARIQVTPPDGMTNDEFDNKVIQVAKSFGNNKNIRYNILPTKEIEGNCNTSTSTILIKSGVEPQEMKRIRSLIPGFPCGFSIRYAKPWTYEEQDEAVKVNEKVLLQTPILHP